ncbi:hypothetical protein [Hyphomicrobium sp. NDB2Meth4]|uniref:hypothetical protein n=1 Tax=Hyphomicrobium sp. NDB2Meth4 TaxID=1892846 RepID=UPI000AFFBD95|nr:hypothetical protein [Hyphomicrobium sp. NDB2Meth4]
MSAVDEAFEVQVATYGSGWKGISVGVANGVRPASLADKPGVFCLTYEAIAPDEFERGIDELISQLQRLKAKGRKTLERIARAEAASRL